MNLPYNAPHQGRPAGVHGAPNAALLIDFDNVTMGIRSDLTKELKNLLNSEVIRGKVAVQRAYADWRRYPQYIVPLAEASVDLIFAPAYGSSKKNATDIRMAIDGLELVFTRPEIGVFILLSGDSDFSSLVLKLKEYGKYVIGVGIKESSSDLLVQNCDEYYSYNALTGLTKAGDEKATSAKDPWELVEAAIGRMVEQNDVMRSDRLKQVMLEMDEAFDEKEIGYTKYNKFLTDAASKGKLKLRKLENGQFEVGPPAGGRSAGRTRSGGGAARAAEGGRDSRAGAQPASGAPTLDESYALLRRAVKDLSDSGTDPVRDSDVKRRMLEIRSDWDESSVGFSKFSHFLRQAHNSEIIDLRRAGDGIYHVIVSGSAAGEQATPEEAASGADAGRARPEPRREGRESRGGRGNGRGRRGGRDREEREARPSASDAGRPSPSEAARPERSEAAQPSPRARPERSNEASPDAERTRSDIAAEQAREAQLRQTAETDDSETESAPAPQAPQGTPTPEAQAPQTTPAPEAKPRGGAGRGMRGGRRGAASGPPPLLEGQTVSLGGTPRTESAAAQSGTGAAKDAAQGNASAESLQAGRAEDAAPAPSGGTGAGAVEDEPILVARVDVPGLDDALDARALGLPTDRGAVLRYLTNRYRGVGDRTAEAVVDAFGAGHVFAALHAVPDRVVEVLGDGRRATALVEAWQEDYARRSGTAERDTAGAGASDDETGGSDAAPA